MSYHIYELEATLNLASLEAATAKANLEKLTVELQQAKIESNQSCWEKITERNLRSPLLTNLNKFN